MKKVSTNIEHRIQLKEDEIRRYHRVFQNYPPDRMKRFGEPHLKKLHDELMQLKVELVRSP